MGRQPLRMKQKACSSTRQWYRTVLWLWMWNSKAVTHTRLSLTVVVGAVAASVLASVEGQRSVYPLEGRGGQAIAGCGCCSCIYCISLSFPGLRASPLCQFYKRRGRQPQSQHAASVCPGGPRWWQMGRRAPGQAQSPPTLNQARRVGEGPAQRTRSPLASH